MWRLCDARRRDVRFFLDNDVDAAVGGVLRAMDHDCWTAADAGLSAAEDDEITVYAIDHDATVVSHDREFAERRRHNTIGRHLQLRCPQWEAAEVLKRSLSLMLPALEAREHVLVSVSSDGFRVFTDWT